MVERRKGQQPFSGPERRKRGRPPLVEGERADDVTVRLTADLHRDARDLADRSADYNGSISAVIRDALARFLQAEVTPI